MQFPARVLVVLAGFLTLALILPCMETRASFPPHRPLRIAHRGASAHAPENTLPAFDRAVELKADVIELDLRMSKDGRLVVIHDPFVDRTTNGTGRVGDLTWRELRNLDAGNWFHPSFKGTRIPSLEEVLTRYRGKIGILIEIKTPRLYEGIERKLAEMLVLYGMNQAPYQGKVAVQSFDGRSIRRFRRLMPDIPAGVLTNSETDLRDVRLRKISTYSDFISIGLGLATRPSVERIHARGMKVLVWTVTDPLWIEPLREMGVDGIITDDPEFFDAIGPSDKPDIAADGLFYRLAGT